jgi:hypothetical protein
LPQVLKLLHLKLNVMPELPGGQVLARKRLDVVYLLPGWVSFPRAAR